MTWILSPAAKLWWTFELVMIDINTDGVCWQVKFRQMSPKRDLVQILTAGVKVGLAA
jgi:hypothetical protein